MAEQSTSLFNNESSVFSWMKAAADTWMNSAKKAPRTPDSDRLSPSSEQSRFLQQIKTNWNLFNTLSAMMIKPESVSAAANSVSALPDITLKMSKSAFDTAFQVQNNFLEKLSSIGKHTEAYNFDNLDQEIFKTFTDIYEKELRQYLQIPPLGLARFYFERSSTVIDKHNLFQTTLAEFFSILYLPVEKSFKVHQESLQRMADEGKLPQSSKDHYGMWIKILEGHYMSLFKSEKYTGALHRTLNQLEDFLIAKNDAMRDYLQVLPVVTHQDMHDLYKEFHVLKKRVKYLEKQLDISPNRIAAIN